MRRVSTTTYSHGFDDIDCKRIPSRPLCRLVQLIEQRHILSWLAVSASATRSRGLFVRIVSPVVVAIGKGEEGSQNALISVDGTVGAQHGSRIRDHGRKLRSLIDRN